MGSPYPNDFERMARDQRVAQQQALASQGLFGQQQGLVGGLSSYRSTSVTTKPISKKKTLREELQEETDSWINDWDK